MGVVIIDSQLAQDVLDEARPEVALDVVPRVEFDLRDELPGVVLALHPAGLARFLRERGTRRALERFHASFASRPQHKSSRWCARLLSGRPPSKARSGCRPGRHPRKIRSLCSR